MEVAFRAQKISVGKIVDDEAYGRITPAANHYCELLVAHLTTDAAGALRSTDEVLAMIGPLGPGDEIRNQVAMAGASLSTALQQSIAKLVGDELPQPRNYDAMGLGWISSLLEVIIKPRILRQFNANLHYSIRSCIDTPFNEDRAIGYTDIDLVVRVRAELFKLPNPIDYNLIDGMLVSETVVYHHEGSIPYCVCLDKIALWPSSDSEIVVSPDDEAHDGTFRVQPNGYLSGHYNSTYDMPSDSGYLVFTNPVFLQGVMSMDRLLNAEHPSFKDPQVYQGGRWVTAVVNRATA